jgi:hypothetical protein
MSDVVCDQVLVKQPGESILYGISFADLLDAGETLSSPTVTDTPTGDLTIGTPAVNTATFVDIKGDTVAIGEGVQVRISAGTDGVRYRIEVSCTTTDSNTREVDCLLDVQD